jgi:glycosyltransferase involved in cell wall biosynthesis
MKILDNTRFMKLINGELVKEFNDISNRKILYLKHPSWQEPENKEHGIGGINAVGRVIYNHIKIKETLGYKIDLMFDEDLTQENAKEYDFIHCSFWFQCFRCIRMGIPYILNIHDNNPLLEKKGSDFYNVYSKAIDNSIVTVAQTDQAKEHWDHLAHKILTVPVPIDTDYLTIDNSAEREDFILCVGAIQKIKGHRYLARACNDLKVKLLVIGNPDDVEEVQYLKDEIAKSAGRIRWIDNAIPFVELIDYYRKCKVFAMTTKMDVPGLVYLEALSCGANVVATEQGDYKSENPNIVRCTLDIQSIKNALEKSWSMPYNKKGREYVINKHYPKTTVKLYEKLVYNGDWNKNYSILDRTSSLYDMDFSDETKITFWFGNAPFDFRNNIDYEFNSYDENGNGIWVDSGTMSVGSGVFRTFSSAHIENNSARYEVKLNNTLIESGNNFEDNNIFNRNFHVDDLEFLKNNSEINNILSSNNDINKYMDHRIRGKEWDLYIDSIEKNGVSLELYSWPLVTEDFCSDIIQKAELCGEWTTDRHEYYPTHDILLEKFGYQGIWNSILSEYAHPVVAHIWGLSGYTVENECFIVKYDLQSEGFQPDLGLHHDQSDYTLVVGLNDEYEGGGTWFPKQKVLINRDIGQVTLHPNVTHKHGARAVISGIRYVLVTFVRKTVT